MPRPTGFRLENLCESIEICAVERGYGYVAHNFTKGSIYSFKFFEKKDDPIPCVIINVHVGHNKKREIYSDDLKKFWQKTTIPRERLLLELEKNK